MSCEAHESLSSRVNTIWGAGLVLTSVLALILGIFVSVSQTAFGGIGENKVKILGVQELVQETNINLKVLMEAQGVEYIEPSK